MATAGSAGGMGSQGILPVVIKDKHTLYQSYMSFVKGGGLFVPFCLGCGDRRSPLEAGVPTKDPNPIRRKLYWKIKKDK